MKVLSHRGLWKEPGDKNSIAAFVRSLDRGFGIETDIRDYDGRLVISHDVPCGNEVMFEEVLQLFHNNELPLAVNIKADGLAVLVKRAIGSYNIKNWFVFDMSVPDMRNCLDEGIPVFARMSEVEKTPPWIEEVSGIWFDSFSSDGYSLEKVSEYLSIGKQVCMVSPELHKRPYEGLWRDIVALSDQDKLMICTDHPERARRFFKASNL